MTTIRIIAHNVTSPIGLTTDENVAAVIAGRSALRRHEGKWGLPDAFCASLFDDTQTTHIASCLRHNGNGLTRFEQLCIYSAQQAISTAGINAADADTQFFIATTKGNVELLDNEHTDIPSERTLLGRAAETITSYFGNTRMPIVVSNACISGLCAQIAAMRSLTLRQCRHAVVIGADVQSRFIVSGFQSAATMILGCDESDTPASWRLAAGAIRNDANHISGPSRIGEGSFNALRCVMHGVEPSHIAVINAHGTATPYNDDMEAIALARMGLQEIPVNTLKGTYGHTMGAAGVLESLLSMTAADQGLVLPTRGYETCGTAFHLNISRQQRTTNRHTVVKLISGFGGCNAAMRYEKGGDR